ncbi:MAG: AAA family ATPase [Verrucomicrobiales bacterium]|jgi:predicted kinase|nr:AAA family ATPase [Verrucomicrobiales bacterium]
MLLIFSGLPGTGKTTIARQVAKNLSAFYLRIDTLEQMLVHSGLVKKQGDLGQAGYMIGYSQSAENLRLGLTVVADSVNPLKITRDAWRNVAIQAEVPYLEIELICSDQTLHRERVETRLSDIPGLVLPNWQSVINRQYEPWDREHLILDTAKLHPDEAVGEILKEVRR